MFGTAGMAIGRSGCLRAAMNRKGRFQRPRRLRAVFAVHGAFKAPLPHGPKGVNMIKPSDDPQVAEVGIDKPVAYDGVSRSVGRIAGF